MNRKQRTDEKKIRTIENWMQRYTTDVLRFAAVYTNSRETAEDLVVTAFAQAYRRMDFTHVYLTDKNALFGGVVTACRAYDAALVKKVGKWSLRKKSRDGAFDVGQPEGNVVSIDGVHGRAKTEDDDESNGRIAPELPPENGKMPPVAELIRRLTPDLRIVFALSVVAELATSDITRILLLPRRGVESRLRSAKEVLTQDAPVVTGIAMSASEIVESVRGSLRELSASEGLRTRIHKVVAATAQQVNAERRHRGPRWLRYATIGTAILSIAAIDVGVHAVRATHTAAPSTVSITQNASGLPTPLSGLPVAANVQFKLSQLPDASSLNHIVLSNSGIYLPKLEQSPNAWPSISVQYAAYSDKGKEFKEALQTLAAIDMVPPIDKGARTGVNGSGDWKVVDWRFDVTGKWAIASVNWMSGKSMVTVTQLYLLYLPTGQSNQVLTIGNPNGSTTTQMGIAAAGSDRVIVQRAVENITSRTQKGSSGNASNSANNSAKNTVPNTGLGPAPTSPSTNNLVGLPVDVYRLTGSTPLRALVKSGQIPAPFGLMEHPFVFSTGVLFTGIVGQPSNTNDANSTWYLMSWNGDLTRFVGPPIDGQSHYAVIGNNEDLWWAETTPSQGTNPDAHWQVLMAPLTGDSSGQSPAMSLSGPVAWFGAYNTRVAWIQNTDDQLQLVVASVK